MKINKQSRVSMSLDRISLPSFYGLSAASHRSSIFPQSSHLLASHSCAINPGIASHRQRPRQSSQVPPTLPTSFQPSGSRRRSTSTSGEFPVAGPPAFVPQPVVSESWAHHRHMRRHTTPACLLHRVPLSREVRLSILSRVEREALGPRGEVHYFSASPFL